MPMSPEERAEKLAIEVAILTDRQNRFDTIQLTVVGKLDSIQRDVSALREEHYQQIDKLHERITAEKNKAHDEMWTAIREGNTRVDSLKNWVILSLGSALTALAVAWLTRGPSMMMHP